MTVWPQWRSALIWDFWAILSYILFSIIFWYVGLIPDLATFRDRAKTPMRRDSLRRVGARLARLGAALARLRNITRDARLSRRAAVVSLHSVVGMDFAASLMPGWQETIFPPYFVVGAMYSGFAMVVCLAALVRWGFSMQALITIAAFRCHGEDHARCRGHHGTVVRHRMVHGLVRRRARRPQFDRLRIHRRLLVDVSGLLFCNVIVPQAFWFGAVRRNIFAVFVIAVLINIGMWLERILIIWNTLSHDYLPSMWRLFLPTIWDWLLLFGSLGLFALMFLVFVRLVPIVSMHEVRRLVAEESAG